MGLIGKLAKLAVKGTIGAVKIVKHLDDLDDVDEDDEDKIYQEGKHNLSPEELEEEEKKRKHEIKMAKLQLKLEKERQKTFVSTPALISDAHSQTPTCIYCSKCGSNNQTSFKFCWKCGEMLNK